MYALLALLFVIVAGWLLVVVIRVRALSQRQAATLAGVCK